MAFCTDDGALMWLPWEPISALLACAASAHPSASFADMQLPLSLPLLADVAVVAGN